MYIYKHSNPDTSSLAVAEWITDHICNTLQKQERFTIALSGGSTPVKLHAMLTGSPFKEKIDWSRLHIFWGDERVVPFDDSRNNAKMAYDTLLNNVAVPASQIHVMRTDIEPAASASEYEKILHQYFDSTDHSFDLVLLGVGDDGHTLSLFPGTSVVQESVKWCTAFFLAAQNMYRITLTKTIVNKAARVAFLTYGNSKEHVLKKILLSACNPDEYPAQVIKPANGELHWFVDDAAAPWLKL